MSKEKILKDELLSEEQLENVVGGTIAETVKDTQFLHALGLLDRTYTDSEIQNDIYDIYTRINDALENFSSSLYMEVNEKRVNDYRLMTGHMGDDYIALTRAEFYAKVCEEVGQPGFDYKKYL